MKLSAVRLAWFSPTHTTQRILEAVARGAESIAAGIERTGNRNQLSALAHAVSSVAGRRTALRLAADS